MFSGPQAPEIPGRPGYVSSGPDSRLHWIPRSGRPPNLGGLSVCKTLHLVADIAEGYKMF
ncbi:hypothetical protein MDOR_12240 [Mycolicibacterium doricum]|uniref:Uncharacterized protein n=1 Tax=Mycolicibacterium doricum TaxID=126673 RepID=A0A7I7VRP1_9MYCO|nr:hypothetical protein MDOR_12240 [Mycolicibacterium doricum]